MDEINEHDLLIRIDERQQTMSTDIIWIKESLGSRPCLVHAEKIKTLERITWGAVIASLAAVVKSFWVMIVKVLT